MQESVFLCVLGKLRNFREKKYLKKGKNSLSSLLQQKNLKAGLQGPIPKNIQCEYITK